MAKRRAVQQDDFAEAVTHLKYLGYEVSAPDEEGWVFAKHPVRYDIHLRPVPMGIRLNCAVPVGAEIGSSRRIWLEFLNSANGRAHIAQFSLSDGDDEIVRVRMAALINGPYTRQVFAMMMDLWHEDLDIIRRRRHFPLADSPEEEDESDAAARKGSGPNVH